MRSKLQKTGAWPLVSARWPSKPLAEVVSKLFVGIPTSRYAAKPGEEGIQLPVLSVGDIVDGRIAPADSIPRLRLRAADLERFRVHAGDVVVSCRGTLLKVALVSDSDGGTFASSNLITIRPDPQQYLPQLLLALFGARSWQDILKHRSRSATGLMQLTVRDLEDLPVPMLPLELQTTLAELHDAGEHSYRAALMAAGKRRELVDSFIVKAMLGPSHEDSS